MPRTTRRALLFMPGDDRRKIEKGAALDVDAIIMDLEDGVAPGNKSLARDTVAQALREIDFGDSERLVRLNSLGSGLAYDDFSAIIESRPDGIVLPKVQYAGEIQDVASWLTRAESRYKWADNLIPIIAIVETALGIVNLSDIARASPRLKALAFGAEDLAGSMGAIRTPDGWEAFYARSSVVLHAKAYGLQAIDTPFVDLKADDDLLIADTEQAYYMGYTGKLAIHPRQVKVIQQVFTPSASQIDHARRLLEAYKAHEADGSGVFVFEGKMVDMPMVRVALNILEHARSAGIDV